MLKKIVSAIEWFFVISKKSPVLRAIAWVMVCGFFLMFVGCVRAKEVFEEKEKMSDS